MLKGWTVSAGKIRSQRHLGHCVCLRCWALPHRYQEPGGRHLLPGGQDRRHHLPPAGPAQGLLAPCSRLHHGRGGHNCRLPRCLLPGDSREETPWDDGRCYQVKCSMIWSMMSDQVYFYPLRIFWTLNIAESGLGGWYCPKTSVTLLTTREAGD